MSYSPSKLRLPRPEEALAGRATALPVPAQHAVLGTPLIPPFPATIERFYVGMGCFWGAERCFWTLPGVFSTAVGYAGGTTPNPSYHEVCTGMTGHTEVVMVAFDPAKIAFAELLRIFWESHDPTQGMRQGNDVGTQYRSALYLTTAAQLDAALESARIYGERLLSADYSEVSTEILQADYMYYAEAYHQQYLHKNPEGYCGLEGTGVACPIPGPRRP
ncbi:MAG: peptide-methionine (S)-S-oxide reductase MsrA [Polyangiales bacterium]